jgi:glutaredoxin-related protein
VALLAEVGCNDYGSFDIFSDDAVREGLKEFSSWPTYPQLYIDGELVGGLDVMQEMKESGDLEAALNAPPPLEATK